MTEEQKIAYLAEFMGWSHDPAKVEAARPEHMGHSYYDNGWLNPKGKWQSSLTFDPLHDWNHWRQVEEKVLEDDDLSRKFIVLVLEQETGPRWDRVRDYPKAKGVFLLRSDLPTRVDALIQAHSSLLHGE